MSWVMVAVGGAGAIKGAIDTKENRKMQKEHDAYRKTAIAMSPWTGLGDPGAGNFGNQNYASSILGGAAQGAMVGQALGGAGAAAGASGATTGAASTTGAAQGAMAAGSAAPGMTQYSQLSYQPNFSPYFNMR